MSVLQSSWSSNFEFIFADAPYAFGAWIPDSPGGKDEPSTDPNWASESVEYLDGLVQEHGPFHGILGYSQGAAFVPLYLSHAAAGSFQVAMLFCGYLPTAHLGLLAAINSGSPFGNIHALVFMGANDWIITNEETLDQAALFSSPVVITSSTAGHNLPGMSDSTYSDVVAFLEDSLPAPTASPTSLPTPTPTPAPSPAPTLQPTPGMVGCDTTTVNVAETDRTYSSVFTGNAPGTGHARSTLDSVQAWSADPPLERQWVQMDMGSVMTVMGVVTQGRNGVPQWVTSYTVAVSTSGDSWEDVDGTFTGNGDMETKVEGLFSAGFQARYVRINPTTMYGWESMRADVLICA